MDDLSFILESPLLPFVEHSFAGIALARPNPWRLVYANSVLSAWLECSASKLPAHRLEELFSTSPPSQLLDAIAAVWQGTTCEATISARLAADRLLPTPVELRFVRTATANEALLGIMVREAERPQAGLAWPQKSVAIR